MSSLFAFKKAMLMVTTLIAHQIIPSSCFSFPTAIQTSPVVSSPPRPSSSSTTMLYTTADEQNAAATVVTNSATDEEEETTTTTSTKSKSEREVSMPLTFNEMVRDASDAMKQAQEQSNITRQTVRILLPRDASSGQLGQYFEDDAQVQLDKNNRNVDEDLVLVPPDETWQGGIMQLYRAAEPTCREILRRVSKDMAGVPPKIIEDTSIDSSGVDGVGILMTNNRDPKDDISCFVQPLQETVPIIESISNQAGSRLVVLVNPQWRNVDDALDSASKEKGFFGTLARSLGGKGGSLQTLEDLGYQNVYTIEGYVCKGGNVRLLKRFNSNWIVFAENDAETDYLRVGESKTRPTYQDVDAMLDAKGVSLKYARDIGLAPKLE